MTEVDELMPGSLYRQWWCQACGHTYYEGILEEEAQLGIDDPDIMLGPTHKWTKHGDDLHRVSISSIFKHRNMFEVTVPKRQG